MSLRGLNNDTGLPLCSEEILALQTYEAECERGLMHNATWHQLMAQYRVLYEEQMEDASKCPGGSVSYRDPNFDENHRFNDAGKCKQCGLQQEVDPE